MGKVRNVYVPHWVAWFGLTVVGLTWLWTTYRVFGTEVGRRDLGIDGWAIMSAMMLVVVTLLFLLGYRKLPVYQIEDEPDDS